MKHGSPFTKHLLLVILFLLMFQVSSRSAAALSGADMPVQQRDDVGSDAPSVPPLDLDVVFSDVALEGTVTVRDKAGQVWDGVRAHAVLHTPSGRQLEVIPLQLIGPGEFRLHIPLSRPDTEAELELNFQGRETEVVRRVHYRIDRARRIMTQVQETETPLFPLSVADVRLASDPDVFGYTWDNAAPYSWVDTSGGTTVSLGDDDWVGPLSIGFAFSFYENTYTQFYIDANGYIGFDPAQTASYYANTGVPHKSRPNNIIAPFWDDFNPSDGGVVRYQTFGTAPARYLVVEWNGVPLYGSTGGQTFQVLIFESTNHIKFQYSTARSGDGDRYYGTVGIENVDGMIGLGYPYLIPVTQTLAIQFTYNRPAYNVFQTPGIQGASAGLGETVDFVLTVKNLGANQDTFMLSRPMYEGKNWPVSFYEADGATPLASSSTGVIAAGGEKQIVAKVGVPGDAVIGDWSRSLVRATSQGDTNEYYNVVLDATHGASFAQVYTDNESGDGTQDSENYFDVIQHGGRYIRRVTTDLDNSAYAGIATTRDGKSVNLWNTTYYNGEASVSDIQYAILSRYGNFLQSVTRLTDNSAATQNTYDFSPAADVASNGYVGIGWARQPGTYNVWYAIVTDSGNTIKAPVALTNNTGDYPRDYPPSVAALKNGNFLLAWEHISVSGGPVDVYYAILSNTGSVYKSAVSLTDGTGKNYTPRVASMPNGNAAVVWMNTNAYGYPEIAYAVVSSEGTGVVAPTLVTSNGDSGDTSRYPDVVALSDNRLGVAWRQWESTTGAADIQYTLLDGGPSYEGIYGQVTAQGAPVAGITLVLRLNDGAGNFSTVATTATQADGSYEFVGVSSLPSGQKYYVLYSNGSNGNADNPGYVGLWTSFNLTAYTAGQSLAGGDFDIANVALVSPNSGATVSLPQTFSWSLRPSTPSDSYEFNLLDASDYDPWVATYPLGYVSSYQLTGLPSGYAYGTQYAWFAAVNAPDGGWGMAYELRPILFSASVAHGGVDRDSILNSVDLIAAVERQISERRSVTISVKGFLPERRGIVVAQPSLARAAAMIYTVPNDVTTANVYVSLTTDDEDRLIMTWLDDYGAQYLFYALADKDGNILTPALIYQRTRNYYLWSSWNGYGNDVLRPPVLGHNIAYLPLVIKLPKPKLPQNIVMNGTFEAGLTGWNAGGTASGIIPQAATSTPHQGTYAAVLGQENAPCRTGQGAIAGESWLYQDVTVPDISAPTLTFYYRVRSYDKLSVDKFDRFEISINDTLLGRFGNETSNYGCDKPLNDTGWQLFSYDLSAYRGQTIRLQFKTITYPDDWFSTWTYVDDVTLMDQ
ncbi:MAG: hypothetical protein JXA33_12225 [Anaerolineae bacterium]|nr:hypothetical protein [Anaerolineae bacterium]